MLKSISFKKLAVLTAGLAIVLSSCGLQNSASESSGDATAAGKTKNFALLADGSYCYDTEAEKTAAAAAADPDAPPPAAPQAGGGGGGRGGGAAAAAGPGTYRVKLTIGDQVINSTIVVRADPGAGRVTM